MKSILLILLSFFIFLGCSPKSENEENEVVTPETVPQKLSIKFLDSEFYDRANSQWVTLSSETLQGGRIPTKIPIYSDFINSSESFAMSSVTSSNSQQEDQSFTVDQYNTIPYLRFEANTGATYQWKFVVYDSQGVELRTEKGEMFESNGISYIPFINDFFNGKFFPADDFGIVDSYTYEIQIVAQGAGYRDSDPSIIRFTVGLEIESKEFQSLISQEMNGYSLKDRFNYYYKGTDGVVNDDLDLGYLLEINDNPEQKSLDLRVVFRETPVITMEQVVFEENMIATTGYEATDNITIIRGNQFFEKKIVLNSSKDFNLNLKLNDQDVSLINDKEISIRNLSAGSLWKIGFAYDLNPHPLYPNGQALVFPYRPLCNLATNSDFSPLNKIGQKSSLEQLGGFMALCHPSTKGEEIINPQEMETSPLEKRDTFFNFFNYLETTEVLNTVEQRQIQVGAFNGIKEIEFKIEGCMKVYTRVASDLNTNPNAWEVKSVGNALCGETEEWTPFSITQKFSIFDNIDEYNQVIGLQELVQKYQSTGGTSRASFSINNSYTVDHIY